MTPGIFLGNWMWPKTLNYGQDAYFDVTHSMQECVGPFVRINLRFN